jgi:hypothetical protein
MKTKIAGLALFVTLTLIANNGFRAQPGSEAPYAVRAFTPAHGDLAHEGGVPAQIANE